MDNLKRLSLLQLKAQLEGRELFPWEQRSALQPPGSFRKTGTSGLGVFKAPLMALLNRDPTLRATARQFCKACHDIVVQNTTMVPR